MRVDQPSHFVPNGDFPYAPWVRIRMNPTGLLVVVVGLLLAGCASTPTTQADPRDTPIASGPALASPSAQDLSEPTPTSTQTQHRMVAAPPTNITPPKPKAGRARTLDRIQTKDRVVFFTIDDGGIRERATAKILADTGIPVTAFLTQEYVADSPNFYQRISENDGQVIQNHTVSHPQLPILDLAGQEAEICGANQALSDWYGQRPWILRPPFGESNATTEVAARNCGLDYVVLWTINMPEGGKGRFQYSQGEKLVPGDIILAHWRPDLHRDLKTALRDIRRQGFKVAALQDYLPKVKR